MAKETIFETFMLPSRGKIYDKEVNPVIELSSMKVWQEMKRLSPTDMPYKMMSDIIEECMKEKLSIPVYDLCLGDYQYLLTKLRIVTYGTQYKMNISCPRCGAYEEVTANLDDIEEFDFDDTAYSDAKVIVLPVNGDTIELTYQTPRKLDIITRKSKEMARKLKTNTDYTLMFTLMSIISKVNGQELNSIMLEDYCKNLNMQDTQFLIQQADKFNDLVGLDSSIIVSCPNCGNDVIVPFRVSLRPTV